MTRTNYKYLSKETKKNIISKIHAPFSEKLDLFTMYDSIIDVTFDGEDKEFFSYDELLKVLDYSLRFDITTIFSIIKKLKEEDIFKYIDKLNLNSNNEYSSLFLDVLIKKVSKKTELIELFITKGYINIFDNKNIEFLNYLSSPELNNMASWLYEYILKEDMVNQIKYKSVFHKYFLSGKRVNSYKGLFIKYGKDFLFDYIFAPTNEDTLKFIDMSFKYIKDSNYLIEYFNREYFSNLNQIIITENHYNNLISAYCKTFNLRRKNFEKIIYIFGYNIFKYFPNESLVNIINMNSDDLDKLLSLFNYDSCYIDMDTINTISNAFLQRKFILDNREVHGIFNTFEDMIQSDEYSEDSLRMLIGHIVYQEGSLEKYVKGINLNELCSNLKKGDKKSLDYLHKFTDDYIRISRENYVKENMSIFYSDLNLYKVIEKNYWKKVYINDNSFSHIFSEYSAYMNGEYDEYFETGIFRKIYEYRKNPSSSNSINEIKPYFKIFDEFLNKLYEFVKFDYPLYESDKFVYLPNLSTIFNLLELLLQIDANQVSDNLLNNDKVFDELKELISKYKLLGWNSVFSKVSTECDIDCSEGIMGSIINNYYKIREDFKNKMPTLTQLLDYGALFDVKSKKYLKLIGKDNYKYFNANPSPNVAPVSKDVRHKAILDVIKGAYKREYTSIPPIDKNYYTSSGETLNVIVGNSTDPINLTLGERTGACLRCCGSFHSLFKFSIEDINGFSIKFYDKDTGEFISRVNGIRNGNTLFLNELRESLSKKYSNNDLYFCLIDVIEDIVNISNKSEYPIENAIITSDYALKDYQNEEIGNNIYDSYEAFYGLNFNMGSRSSCIQLYPHNGKINYKFNPNTVKYRTQREKVRFYSNREEAKNQIIRLLMVDELLSGTKIEDINDEVDYDIVNAYVGEDWFVYLDINGEYHKYIMSNSVNIDRAEYEINNLSIELGLGETLK